MRGRGSEIGVYAYSSAFLQFHHHGYTFDIPPFTSPSSLPLSHSTSPPPSPISPSLPSVLPNKVQFMTLGNWLCSFCFDRRRAPRIILEAAAVSCIRLSLSLLVVNTVFPGDICIAFPLPLCERLGPWHSAQTCTLRTD